MPLTTAALKDSKGMPQPARYIYQQAYESKISEGRSVRTARNYALKELSNTGWQQARFGWVANLQASQMVRVGDVKVFAAGTWTDSMGNVREWTRTDLDTMVSAFQAGVPKVVPLKAGHTSDEFNRRIAEALGVPVELLVGENGRGAVSLGSLVELERKDDMLYAQFERVPAQVAEMIEKGLYRTISSEIEDGVSGHSHAITGIAMLGAEEPAVAGTTLEAAKAFGGSRNGAVVYSFSVGEATKEVLEKEFDEISGQIEEAADKKEGAPFFKSLLKLFGALFKQIVGKGSEEPQQTATEDVAQDSDVEEEKDVGTAAEDAVVEKDDSIEKEAGQHQDDVPPIEQIAKALGLEGETDIVKLIEAIEALKGVEEVKAEYASMRSVVETQRVQIAQLEHAGRVHKYMKRVADFSIEGKPQELAEKLASVEEKSGIDEASNLLSLYQQADRVARIATQKLGTARGGEAVSFEQVVHSYQKQHPDLSLAEAYKVVMASHPDLYSSYKQDIQ